VSFHRSPLLQKGLVGMDRNALAYLNDLNRSVDTALTALETLAQYPELNTDDFIIVQAHFREQLGNANMTVLEALEEWEHQEMMVHCKKRMAYEKEVRDPDDCYFDVARREDERREQGLPPFLGILRGMRRVSREDILGKPLGPTSKDDDTEEETDSESEGDQP
jgi:hypothetical protein